MNLKLRDKKNLTSDIWQFNFEKPSTFEYQPGQYISIILPDDAADDRGTKRWFTLSSSPSESVLSITTRIVEKASSFKKDLSKLSAGNELEIGKVEGDFLLPRTGKIVWIAGGIGATPFRSQAKYLLDKGETRDIAFLHGNRTPQDIVYREVFELAAERMSGFSYIPVVESFSGTSWTGKTGHIDDDLLRGYIENRADASYFISGPEPMVDALKPRLLALGALETAVHGDWFPGYIDEFSPQ